MKSALQEELVGKLTKIVAPAYVTTDENRLDELSWDALSEGRLHPANRPKVTIPLCSVLPSSTDEVRQIVLLANREKSADYSLWWWFGTHGRGVVGPSGNRR